MARVPRLLACGSFFAQRIVGVQARASRQSPKGLTREWLHYQGMTDRRREVGHELPLVMPSDLAFEHPVFAKYETFVAARPSDFLALASQVDR